MTLFEYFLLLVSYSNEAGDTTKIRSSGPLFPFFSVSEFGIFLIFPCGRAGKY